MSCTAFKGIGGACDANHYADSMTLWPVRNSFISNRFGVFVRFVPSMCVCLFLTCLSLFSLVRCSTSTLVSLYVIGCLFGFYQIHTSIFLRHSFAVVILIIILYSTHCAFFFRNSSTLFVIYVLFFFFSESRKNNNTYRMFVYVLFFLHLLPVSRSVR